MGEPSDKDKRMRICVLKEISKTEKDYLDTLKFLSSVFMERLESREKDENDKLIPKGSVDTLLSNVTELKAFHDDLYASMETALKPEPMYEHCLGKCFIDYKEKFEVYAPYCTNHERAQKKLNELTENPEFQGFILGCLMLGNYVNDVSMEGFLLTPIQRICKYPLLLKELMKRTPPEHPDHPYVKEALEIMKAVCSNVNETKRQLEQLEKLEELQQTIANWEGANLTDTCTTLIKQGALLKISAGNIQERQFFLFDHLLVYCKKANALPRLQGSEKQDKTATLQKKKTKRKKPAQDQKKWLFKGRISTELMEIESVDDGTSDFHSCGYTVTNGWKILNNAKNKWFVLLAKDKEEKEAWLNEFIMEREKRRSKVSVDQRDTVDVLHSRGKRLYYKATHQNLIKDRKDWLRTHPKALVGNEFVQWLVENRESKSVDEAIMLGQALLDCGILHHVSDKHHFKNENVLYRFRYDDGTFKPRGESQDLIAKGLRIYARLHCLFQPVVRDKDRNLRSYKQVIEARKLIDWMVEQGDCKGREEALNLGQTLCENSILHHALDKQDFKDDSSLFKFWPDEEPSESSNKLRDLVKKASQKLDFRIGDSYQTKTVLLLNTNPEVPLGFEALFVEHHNAVLITAIVRGSQAQVQGLLPGQAIIGLNYSLLSKCKSQEDYELILSQNLKKYQLLYVTVKADEEIKASIPVTKEGMGFQIRSANPSVVHAVTKGGMAMNNGLVRGQAILKVNHISVLKSTHDEVAGAIRDGCKLPLAEDQENGDTPEEKDDKMEETNKKNSLGVSGNGVKRSKSDRRKNIAQKIGIRTPNLSNKDKGESSSPVKKDNGNALHLVLGNRHLERVSTYEFDNTNGVRTSVVEKMAESPSIFDLAAMLLDVLTAEDERVLADVQALESATELIREQQREIFERRRTLRYDVINERLENYKRFKRHLGSYMWPSYKEAKDKPSSGSAKDFCPTNCHINTLQVSHTLEKFNLRGLGLKNAKSEADNTEITKNIEIVTTVDVTTCLSAPSHRSRGREGHGLMAVLRGVEGNMELMDQIRQIMVALDQAVLEVTHCQDQIYDILNSEPRTDGQRNSFQALPLFQSAGSVSSDMTPSTPMSPSTFFVSASSPAHERSSGVFENASNRNSRTSDVDSTPNRTSTLSPTIEVLTPQITPSEQIANGNNRKSLNDDNSGAGNDSECDSGIHSNRGSMVGNEKLIFNFSAPPPGESTSAVDQNGTGSNSGSSTTSEQTNQRMSLALPEDPNAVSSQSGGTLGKSSSLPSLSPTLAANAATPVRMRSKARPHSKVTFSGRDRVSVISKTESNCSSEGIDSIGFIDLVLSPDTLDKLQGTMEHFLGKIRNIKELAGNEVVRRVFAETKEVTPNVDYNKIIDDLAAKTNDDLVKMSLAVCEDTQQFAGSIQTLIEAINKHISQIRTQLVLTVLLNEDPKLVSRRDKVFSQALISVITAFSTQMRCALDGVFNNMKAYGMRGEDVSKKWLEQATSIGALVLFQSHLNLNMPDECAMLEDSYVGIYDLERVSFHFRAITGDVEPNDYPSNARTSFLLDDPVQVDVNGIGYTMEGNRSALKVNFHLEKHIFLKLPPRLQAGGGIKLVPVMFNHGLEDVGSFLYKQGVTLHEFLNSINERALENTYDYYKKYRAFHLDRSKLPRDTEARAVMIDKLSRPLNALQEVMSLIESHVKARPNMPNLSNTGCGILTLAAEFCHRLGGCHLMSCNNGVHRSSIACSMQQSMILARSHSMPPRYLSTAANLFSNSGARCNNSKKNPGTRDTTVKSAPRMYKTLELIEEKA